MYSFVNHVQRFAKDSSSAEVDIDFGDLLTSRSASLTQAGLQNIGYAFQIGNYEFQRKSKLDDLHSIAGVSFSGSGSSSLLTSAGFQQQTALGLNKNLARELANNRYPESITEAFLGEALALQALHPGRVSVGHCFGEDLKKLGLNLLWAVGKGSEQPPGIVNLTYVGDPETEHIQHAIVGKGIVFDCGGLHVKKFGYMEDMHTDKAGAAAVFGAFRAVVELGLKINLTCTIALAENSISQNSYRPSDIYRSYAVALGLSRDLQSRSVTLTRKEGWF